MKRNTGLVLIVLGAVLILAPIVTHAIQAERDKAHIAEFYSRNTNNATLPHELKPSEYAGYDWACFGIGVSLVFTGVGNARRAESGKPGGFDVSEV